MSESIMDNPCLNFKQSICAARIFLNIFGLTLEDVDNINELSKVKIFAKDMNEVGELSFKNGKVIIWAKYNNSLLEASYDIPKILGFIDPECENGPYALFGQWSNDINFQLQKINNINLSGLFSITCSADTEYGITCLCHPLINCEIPGIGQFILKVLIDGSMFNLKIISGEYHELIKVNSWDGANGFILHDVINGKYDEEKCAYPYRRYAGIFNGPEKGEHKDKLQIYLKEEEDSKILTFRNEFVSKVRADKSKENLLQIGILMKDLDPDMFAKILKLREILLIGDISLLDNIFSVCFDSYTDDELYALFGINRQK